VSRAVVVTMMAILTGELRRRACSGRAEKKNVVAKHIGHLWVPSGESVPVPHGR
jgi:hypothetical protein